MGGLHNEPEVETRVIENHNFMNHGEFEVGFGVVDWHTAVLDEANHEQDECGNGSKGVGCVAAKVERGEDLCK